jgi:hypothetical protein
MALYHVICAVRQRPEPEIIETSVPAHLAAREKRRLTLKGFETVFTLRVAHVSPQRPGHV